MRSTSARGRSADRCGRPRPCLLRLTVNWSSAVSFLPLSPSLSSARFAATVGALRRSSICLPPFADAVADEADRIEAAHVLLLQEVDRVAVAFGEQRHQHIGAGYRILARGLDMQDRTLDHPLETRRWAADRALFRLAATGIPVRDIASPPRPVRRGPHRRRAMTCAASSSSISASSRCSSVAYSCRRSPALVERGVKGLFRDWCKAGHSEVFLWDSGGGGKKKPMGRNVAKAV